jgi:hypothetical protein
MNIFGMIFYASDFKKNWALKEKHKPQEDNP